MDKVSQNNKNIISPAFKKNNIPMVIACDDKYVPFTSVLLTSLAENSSSKYNYDILLFQKDISEKNQDALISCLQNKPNISLRFIEMSEQIKNFNLRTFSYYSVEIYFRLFAPWILTAYDKILYFDCDLIFNADIANLYQIDIGNNFLGVVRDLGMILHKNNERSGIPKTYYSEFLNDIDIHNYFNSGVLIMNLDKFRKELVLTDIMSLIEGKKWQFPDQDVLNVLCAEQTYMLPMGWNTIPENSGDRTLENLRFYVPKQFVEPYMESRKNPFIVHYAMREKPWKWSINLDIEMGLIFWKYALKSPLANEVLKIKAKTCSIAELVYILNYFNNSDFCINETNSNIEYLFKNNIISKYSDRVIKFETADFDDKHLKIDGWFTISNFEKMPSEVLFKSNKLSVRCEVLNKNQSEYINDTQINQTYVFKARIPLNKVKNLHKFKLVFVIDNKHIVANTYNFGRYFPTDRIFEEQYFYKAGYILQCTSHYISILPAKKKIAKQKERLFLKRLKKENTFEHKRALKLRKIYNFFKPKIKKQIWLISDNFLADDNGFAFFEYMQKTKPKGVKFFFAISNTNTRYVELKNKFKSKILTYHTARYKFWSLMADVKISSVEDFYFIRPFKNLEHDGRDIYSKQKFIFLQHGVTSHDMSREHNKFVFNTQQLVTVAKVEQHEFQRDSYFYDKEQIILTGFSRFDKLYNTPEKLISIIPTWRKYLIFKNGKKVKISDKEFMNSNYFKFYYSLLNHPKLLEAAKKYGYKIGFMQHPLFIEYNNCFESQNNDYQLLNETHRDVFAKSDLILSDYSSVIFDFLYLRKPIIYTHFDNNEFYSGSHAYDKGFIDHEKDGFGECEFTLEGTVDRLIEYMKNKCKIKDKYLKKINKFFKFDDKNNSKRIFDSVFTLVKHDKECEKNLKYYKRRFFEIKKQYGLKTALKWTFNYLKD